MLRALTTAATGMIAQQNYLDVIANNVANVNTTAFKQSRIEFQDLLSQATRTPGALMNQGTFSRLVLKLGLVLRLLQQPVYLRRVLQSQQAASLILKLKVKVSCRL